MIFFFFQLIYNAGKMVNACSLTILLSYKKEPGTVKKNLQHVIMCCEEFAHAKIYKTLCDTVLARVIPQRC